jgi:hypothetical protein
MLRRQVEGLEQIRLWHVWRAVSSTCGIKTAGYGKFHLFLQP